jgi:F-type H+-transporting ATPase subunit epsilon
LKRIRIPDEAYHAAATTTTTTQTAGLLVSIDSNKRLTVTMMNQRALFQITRRVCAARSMSSESAATAASSVKLNFCLPHEKIYDEVYVHSVIIPGAAGEYGVTANHVPYVAQLKPGVFQIYREENTTEPEKYFVAGGYALTHADSSTVSINGQ